MSMVARALAVSLALSLAGADAVAQTPQTVSRKVYADAVAALKRGDCPVAIALLTQYQRLEAANLAKNPQVATQIAGQIQRCRAFLAASRKAPSKTPRSGAIY
jgi:hypothetical protein